MSARFVLQGIFLSGPTYKVGLFLAMAGEPFDYVHVTPRGTAKTPAYMKLQRYGQVPLLQDRSNGRNLCQSAAILEYLADTLNRFGGATLDERLQAREWMYWEFDRLAGPIFRMRGQRLGVRAQHQPVVEGLFAEGNVALKVLDDHLKGRDWLVGEAPTIADIDIYGVVSYAPVGGFDLAAYPNLSAWKARFEALPGFGPPEAILPKSDRTAA